MNKVIIRRGAAALLAAVLLVCAGWGLRQAFRFRYGVQGTRLERTDLPGFAPAEEQGLVGLMPTENHCGREQDVTFTDDAGRCWRIRVPGWSLLWAETNGVGARIEARNVHTGVLRSLYLGREADTFDFFPQAVGEDLYADALGNIHRFLFWRWRSCQWTEAGFRELTGQMTVEELSPGEVGQRVAFGNHLDLQQTADFNGSLLVTDGRVTAPQLFLRQQAPAGARTLSRTADYTNARGLYWTLQWEETGKGDTDGVCLYARCRDTGDWVEIRLEEGYLESLDPDTGKAALEAAREALDHILPRE